MKDKKIFIADKLQGTKVNLADYTHIRAYHACRIEDENVYRNKGLVAFNPESALKDAIIKLRSGKVTELEIRNQFNLEWESLGTNYSPQIWLMLEKAELLGKSCHYLIYGSEFLNCLAMRLGCRDRLKTIGRPAIIVCDIPIKYISKLWLQGLEKDIWHRNTADRSIAVCNVRPQDIIEIIYPTGTVEDPYTKFQYNL